MGIKITDEKGLLELLPENLRREYCIGIHGFDADYWKREEAIKKYVLDENKIANAKDGILRNGLSFKAGRILLSTVRFSDLSSYISTRDYYDAGGVIVALPKVLRTQAGKTMFLGYPDESLMRNTHWDRNREPISLSEILLPEADRLDSRFVLGTYSKGEDGIEVELNDNHMAFQNNGLVSEEFADKKKSKLREMLVKSEIPKGVIENVESQRLVANLGENSGIVALGRRAYNVLGEKILPFVGGGVKGILSKLKPRDKGNER